MGFTCDACTKLSPCVILSFSQDHFGWASIACGCGAPYAWQRAAYSSEHSSDCYRHRSLSRRHSHFHAPSSPRSQTDGSTGDEVRSDHSRSLHVVPVAVARLASDALESLGAECTAPTHVAGEPTSTETHVAPPRTVAHWHGCFEGSLPVPGTVVVVHTTTCCDVACWQVSSCGARAILVCTTGRARHATQPTLTAVAVKPARPEASVAAPVGALRVRLLKGGEMVEVAVLVVDATTHHGPATRLPCANDSGTVRADTSSLTLGGPNSPNWFLNLDTTAGTNTTHVLGSLLTAASIAAIVTATEARVADTAISMHPHLLEARQ